jgi:hypothetical protein
MLQNKLLKVQERAFVRNFLPNLDKGFPSVFRRQFSTVWTLPVLNQVFDLEHLL